MIFLILNGISGPIPDGIRKLRKYGKQVTTDLVFKLFLKQKRKNRLQFNMETNQNKDFYQFSRYQSIFQYNDEHKNDPKVKISTNIHEDHFVKPNQVVLGQAIGSIEIMNHSNNGSKYYSIVHI